MNRTMLALALVASTLTTATIPARANAATASVSQADWNAAKKFVRLPNGMRLAYHDLGNPNGRPLLLLHGYTDSSRAWSTLVPSLQDYRLLIPDQRGHGRSDAPDCCYALVEFSNDAHLFLDALGIDKAAVAGHSLGSIVAMQLAADHPEQISGLVLVGSTALAPVQRGDWLWTQIDALRQPIGSNAEFLRQWSAGAGPVAVDPDFVRHSDADVAAVPPHVWRSVLRELVAVPAARHAADVEAPVLILSGGKDEIFPPDHHAALLKAFPGAKARIFPELGHNLVWERPAQIASEISRFLEANPPK